MNVWKDNIRTSANLINANVKYLHRWKPTSEKSGFSKQIGTPDLMILFTNTVSHKMVLSAVTEAKKNDVNIVRTHSSSAASLTSVLETYLSESRAC